jgi:asparagine synthase (glutamine-hydrolysing)
MCGVAGVVRLGAPVAAHDVRAVLRMLDAQVHRGPDDWGLLLPEEVWRDPDVRGLLERRGPDHVRTYPRSADGLSAVLGSRRLSILDRSARGRMPMGSADGLRWISHNGEIYNYLKLRSQLQISAGSVQSESDTEVILRGYEEWGEDVVRHLRGMFGFALLDLTPPSRILLARDRFGIKPLYYHLRGDLLLFASEVRAISSSGLVTDEENPDAFVRFLQLGSVPAPLTTLKDVFALPAGHCLGVSRRGARLGRYWDLSAHLDGPADRSPDAEGSRRDGDLSLEDCVELHLLSDAPVGLFLSGGIDSSALVAVASRLRDRPLITVSLVFDERAYSESRFSNLVAKRYGTDHHELLLRSEDFVDELPRVFAAMDQPTADGVNTYFVSRAARAAGLTVALSGTGADEVFLGYRHLRSASALEVPWRVLRVLPSAVRKAVLRAGMRLAEAGRRRELPKLAYLENPSSAANAYLVFRGLFTPAQTAQLLDDSRLGLETQVLPSVDGRLRHQSLLQAFTLLDFEHYLQNQLLKDSDVMGMAHSLEIRVPYLDHELVQRAVGVSPAERIQPGLNKPLLLWAAGESLPREVWQRPKMGFTLPFGEWLRRWGQELRAATLECGFLRRQEVERVWAGFLSGRVHWSRPWALAVLARFR